MNDLGCLVWAILFVLCLIAGPLGWLVFLAVWLLLCLPAAAGSLAFDARQRWRTLRTWIARGCPVTPMLAVGALVFVLLAVFWAWAVAQPSPSALWPQ